MESAKARKPYHALRVQGKALGALAVLRAGGLGFGRWLVWSLNQTGLLCGLGGRSEAPRSSVFASPCDGVLFRPFFAQPGPGRQDKTGRARCQPGLVGGQWSVVSGQWLARLDFCRPAEPLAWSGRLVLGVFRTPWTCSGRCGVRRPFGPSSVGDLAWHACHPKRK